jgi:hypothetical protein
VKRCGTCSASARSNDLDGALDGMEQEKVLNLSDNFRSSSIEEIILHRN